MNTLDNLYEKSFIVNENIKIENNNNVLVIKNLFKYPDLVLDFQNLLSKWESFNSSKPGVTTLPLPCWTANYVHSQIFKFEYNRKRSETEFVYFYWNNTSIESEKSLLVSNNCLLPHSDSNAEEEGLIFLINLNNRPIRTGFWKYRGNRLCRNTDEEDEYYSYVSNVTEDNYHDMVVPGILEKEIDIEYGFNDAILYQSSRYHQPIIDNFFTRENPRIILRYYYNID